MLHIRLSLTALMLALAATFTAGAGEPASETADSLGLTAARAFTVAPSSVIPTLTPTVRLDMLDFFRAGSDRASINSMEEEARILQESDYSLTYTSSTGIECQLFILNPTSTEPLIGIITTINTPIPDSNLVIYNRNWRILPRYTEPFPPALAQWLTPQGKRNRNLVEEQIPFILAVYSYNPETGTLTITNNTPQYFDPQDTPEAVSLLRNALEYKWTGKKFKAN